MCVSVLIVCLENKPGQELFVVKIDCNVSVVVCRKILSPLRQFQVKDLICDTSQFFRGILLSSFFKRVTSDSLINQVQV